MELSSRNNKIYGNVVLSVDLKDPFLYLRLCHFPEISFGSQPKVLELL